MEVSICICKQTESELNSQLKRSRLILFPFVLKEKRSLTHVITLGCVSVIRVRKKKKKKNKAKTALNLHHQLWVGNHWKVHLHVVREKNQFHMLILLIPSLWIQIAINREAGKSCPRDKPVLSKQQEVRGSAVWNPHRSSERTLHQTHSFSWQSAPAFLFCTSAFLSRKFTVT